MPAMNITKLVQDIDDWLPQTQCTLCGYPRCHDYAQAIANQEADINRCPPGSDITIKGLAVLLELPEKKLDPEVGSHKPRRVYFVDEARCIGCTLCIKACPVDAIVGSGKLMHSILASECTGCDLCVPPCPMDCILSKPYNSENISRSRWPEYSLPEKEQFRARTNQRLARLDHHRVDEASVKTPVNLDSERIRSEINDAVARVRQKKALLNKDKI